MSVVFLIIYIVFFPVLNFLLISVKNSIRNYMRGGKRSKTSHNTSKQKELLYDKVKKRILFTLKEDKRVTVGVKNKLIFLILYIVGAILAILAGLQSNVGLLLSGIIFQASAFAFSVSSTNTVMKARDELLTRMISLKSERMGLITGGKEGPVNVNAELKITQWDSDYIHPLKAHIYMPTSFDKLKVTNFLTYFNEIFSSKGVWVANLNDEEYKGFDFHSGVASLVVTPPLPKMATWHERYLNSDDIAWSFFPMALGSENGIKMLNEETGEYEHVLGFALNNDQKKKSTKKGVYAGPDIVSAPQVLVAGGTGGGKSLSLDTDIEVELV